MKIYASFFEWPDKALKELGIVEELLRALNRDQATGLGAPSSFTPDPPDCFCMNANGGKLAFEVAEVVCEDAARLCAKGKAVLREWRPGELTSHISRLLTQKDGKTFHGGPYEKIVACLFTDEPMLSLERLELELAGRKFGPYSQLTQAFLVVSYDPATKTYPVFELPLSSE